MSEATSKKVSELLDSNNSLSADRQTRYSLIIDRLPVPICYIDNNFIYRLSNKAHQAWWGKSKADIVGHKMSDIHSAAGLARVEPYIKTVLSGMQVTFEYDLVLSHLGERHLFVNYLPDSDEDGNIQGFCVILNDITDKRKTEQDLVENNRQRLELEQQLRQSQKMEALGTLAGGVAHDFNNILSSILGYTELALTGLNNNRNVSNFIEQVHSSALRAKDLVQQILAFSQKQQVTFTSINVASLITDVIATITPTFPATIKIKTHLEEFEHFVRANETQIHQILLNLCLNARDAMFAGPGELSISVKNLTIIDNNSPEHLRQGTYVEIIVADTGHGMSTEVKKRIFEPYFTTKGQGQGTGLGLSVVHGLVVSHGGVITVESEPQSGTRFRVLLPSAPQIKAPVKEDSKPIMSLNTGTILFVDDEPVLTQLGCDMLSAVGYKVIPCTNSQQAVQIFEKEFAEIDLVISDQTMPGISGHVLSRRLKKIKPDIAIILCTGFSIEISGKSAEEVGVSAVLQKPISYQTLTQVVAETLINSNKISRASKKVL